MSAQNYRFKCRNTRCGYECHRRYNSVEFDEMQYGGSTPGINCFQCGFPKMMVMRSNQSVKDTFQPGFQRNIGKHCATYSQYKQHLKEMGLVEIGYEELKESEDGSFNYWDDESIKKVIESGVYLSGREIEALKQGRINEM